MLAMLLAFASQPEELEVLMLSLQFGNVEVQKYVVISQDFAGAVAVAIPLDIFPPKYIEC